MTKFARLRGNLEKEQMLKNCMQGLKSYILTTFTSCKLLNGTSSQV